MVSAIFSPDTCTEIATMLEVLKGRRGEGEETGRELLASLGLTSEPRLSSLFGRSQEPQSRPWRQERVHSGLGIPTGFVFVCFFLSVQRRNIIASIKILGT